MENNIKRKKRFEIDMCNGNLFTKIIIFSVPLMLMGMLQLLYNAADLIVVGKFGDDPDALGAVGSTASLINLVVTLFMGLSVGTNVSVAKLLGAKDYDRVGKVVHTSILISIIVGTFLGIFGFFFAETLLEMMHNDLPQSVVYLKIYFIGMPFNMLYNFAAAVLRAVGDTKRPLYFLTISGIINVILNLIFVIFFNLNVEGVALATVISQVLSCILIMVALYKSDECYRFRFEELRIDKNELLEITKIGLPAGIQSSIFSISNVIIQSSVNQFGPIAMNGNAAASSVEGFVYTAMNSVYHASLAFTSQNVGAKKINNIKKSMWYSLIIVTMFALALGVPLFLFGRSALKLYTSDLDSIEVGFIRLHYLCLPYFLCGIMDVMVGVLRGIGYSTIPMIVSIVGVCGFRVAWIFGIFYQNTNFTNVNDLHLLYASYPISWIITFTVHLICYFILSKKVFRIINDDLILSELHMENEKSYFE